MLFESSSSTLSREHFEVHILNGVPQIFGVRGDAYRHICSVVYFESTPYGTKWTFIEHSMILSAISYWRSSPPARHAGGLLGLFGDQKRYS